MPPRRGIVKSGNAGNSSKPSKPTEAKSSAPADPPLFPPGFKYPLSLLNEHCQKQGWDRPVVETRQKGNNGFSFTVILSRQNKKAIAEKDTVKLESHPPYFRPSAIEARHWGATYALYRFCNGIQLHLVLPPGPRDYWNQLAEERKVAPEHLKWMYEADPFAARQTVEERQVRAAEKREENASGSSDRVDQRSTNPFSTATEVRMATSLREMVEDAIKQGIELYPEAEETGPLILSEDGVPDLSKQLAKLGFSSQQIRDATSYLSQPSKLTTNLLGASPPLQACVEYLLLNAPECDLPERFLPAMNSSNPFIVSGHSGTSDLKARWTEEKIVKDAGYPLHSVQDVSAQLDNTKQLDRLLSGLAQKLVGDPIDESNEVPGFTIDPEEYESLGGHLEEDGHLVLPLFSAPIQIHVLFSAERNIPRSNCLPLYITSTSVAPYIRLHLLSRLVRHLREQATVDGEGFCMTVIQAVEADWAVVEDEGRPEISTVLQYLTPKRENRYSSNAASDRHRKATRGPKFKRHPQRRAKSPPPVDLSALRNSKEYKAILEARERLPAYKAKNDFLKLLDQNRVVVVVGETGCGKTTQLPQLILDHMLATNPQARASIVVTQPRRISAISVAARVSQERLEDGSIGYAIRGESRQTKNTQILFCTTGVVLRRLSVGDGLKDVTHIVVDEVHERSVDGDFLLLELKDLLQKQPKLKVILMSATINHEIFSRYFNNAPLLEIPGFTHPVQDRYLEDVIQLISFKTSSTSRVGKDDKERFKELETKYQEQGIDPSLVSTLLNISRSGKINYELIASLVDHIIQTGEVHGGILIFLPGVAEIKQCLDAVKRAVRTSGVTILPLHANLSNDEQRRVFARTNSWKVIAATNVAETSITIDDVLYVIDSGKVKETQYDPSAGFTRLVETQVTKAAAKQRRGRAGRTRPGTCYKLFTRDQERNMASFPVPEIKRVPLESILLSVKATREDEDVKTFLGKAIDPPAIEAVDKAWSILEDLGAVTEEGKLTAMGKHLSMLPMDVRLAKMLVLGVIFRCLSPIVTSVALLSSKPLFFSSMEQREEASVARQRFMTGNSDLLTDINAFEECVKIQKESKTSNALRLFCEQNFISMTTVREVMMLRQDLTSTLAEMDLIDGDVKPNAPHLNTASDNHNLVKAVMLGGLWPRVARVHLPDSAIKFDKVSAGTVRRDNNAKDFKIYDIQEGRVFLHPGSVLFGASMWRSPFLFYFNKAMTSKLFLRDASEVPLYALLLFGGPVSISHILGGLTVGNKNASIKLKAIPRIGTLVNQLRRLLDAQLQYLIDSGAKLDEENQNPVIEAMMALLENDGLTG